MVGWGILIGAAVGFGALIRWMLKWRDPSWDSREGQAKAELWSKLNSGGGAPG